MIDLASPDLDLTIHGVPATAGSKSAFPYLKGYRPDGKPLLGIRMAAGRNAADARKKEQWANAIAAVVLERVLGARAEPLDGPLVMWSEFYLPRPKTVTRAWPIGKPDVSKLIRALEDPIVRPQKGYRGLIADDARIVLALGAKLYADHHRPGARVRFWRLDEAPADFASVFGEWATWATVSSMASA